MPDSNGNTEVVALMRELLGNSYTSLQVHKAVVEENLADDTTSITCEVTYEKDNDERSVKVDSSIDMPTVNITGIFDFGLNLGSIPSRAADLSATPIRSSTDPTPTRSPPP